MAAALTDILINASGPGQTPITLCLPSQSSGLDRVAIQPNQCIKLVFDEPAGPALFSAVHEAVMQNIGSFVKEQGPGVVLLVYSVMLTRGI